MQETKASAQFEESAKLKELTFSGFSKAL